MYATNSFSIAVTRSEVSMRYERLSIRIPYQPKIMNIETLQGILLACNWKLLEISTKILCLQAPAKDQ